MRRTLIVLGLMLLIVPQALAQQDKLEEAIKTAASDKSRIAVLFVDLDFFKTFNDSLGHDAGDTAIGVAVAVA